MLSRYRHAGGGDGAIHRYMTPHRRGGSAAAHLCASQLPSVHPATAFDNTRVYTMPYGIGEERGVAIGSLDLIAARRTRSLFATGQRQAQGAQGDVEIRDVKLPRESVDLVIMNPHFTHPTNHEIAQVPVPSFAGFRTGEDEQRAMSDRLTDIRRELKRPAGHGNAGLASNFVDLAHAKAKAGGVVALVLPIAAIQGDSWRAARDLLADKYADIAVVSVAASGVFDRAFSADTGIAEALVVATKRRAGNGADGSALFVNLHRRPATALEAAETANLVARLPKTSSTGRIHAGADRSEATSAGH